MTTGTNAAGLTHCTVCAAPLGEPIYRSAEPYSITSLCQILTGHTQVYYCGGCGHLMTPPLPDLAAFYDQEYTILIDSEDEDQLYELRDGRAVYRYDHQADTVLAKLDIGPGARVLEYGAAKGATLRRVMARRPDVRGHLFDVSSMYKPFWDRFCPPENCATHRLPASWAGSFDHVLAFFVLEHVAAPRDMAAGLAGLLRPGGWAYLIVPSVATNVGDFVVADHVNHFSPASLRRVMEQGGFMDVEVDDQAHRAALVVRGRKGTSAVAPAEMSAEEARALAEQAGALARRWRGYAEAARALEQQAEGPVAIYGSGVYSTFLMSSLRHPERVRCFLDRNPHRQGKRHLERDVLAPVDLPADINNVYVALNPAVARQEMRQVPGWEGRAVNLLYP